MSTKPVRRAVRSLSVREKLQAIERVHEGESKAAVARDIGVPESTLRGWCKGEEKLRGSLARPGSPPPSPPDHKVPRLSDPLDAPLDFSSSSRDRDDDRTCFSIAAPKQKQDTVAQWLQNGQAAQPLSPLEARTADNSSWFWKLYKNYGLLQQGIYTKKSDNLSEEEYEEAPATTEDAVHHGEKFLRWLEECSDPSITALQILQFRYLLNNVKDSAERRKQVKQQRIHRRK